MSNAVAVEAQAHDPNYREYILSQLRCAALRARLIATELDTIGVSLRARWISADDALAEVAEIGALGLVTGVDR